MWVVRGSALGCSVGLAAWFGPAVSRSRMVRLVACPRLSGQVDADHIGISFDDGPHAAGTPAVLDALCGLGVRATFFLLGSQVARYPELALRIVAEGHEIGVHGLSHRNHLWRGPRDIHRDVQDSANLITAVTGVRPRLFRPPYGVFTAASLLAARAADLRPVLWTAWGRDWETVSSSRVLTALSKQLDRGGTILLHDSDVASASADTWMSAVGALPAIAARARELKCELGPVGEHLRLGRA